LLGSPSRQAQTPCEPVPPFGKRQHLLPDENRPLTAIATASPLNWDMDYQVFQPYKVADRRCYRTGRLALLPEEVSAS